MREGTVTLLGQRAADHNLASYPGRVNAAWVRGYSYSC